MADQHQPVSFLNGFHQEDRCPLCECDKNKPNRAIHFCPLETSCKRNKIAQDFYCVECHQKYHRSHDQYSINSTIKNLEKQWLALDDQACKQLSLVSRRYLDLIQLIDYCDEKLMKLMVGKNKTGTTIKEDFKLLKELHKAIQEFTVKIQDLLGGDNYSTETLSKVIVKPSGFDQNLNEKDQKNQANAYPMKELLKLDQLLQPLCWKLLEDLKYLNDLTSDTVKECYWQVFLHDLDGAKEIESFTEYNYKTYTKIKQEYMIFQMHLITNPDGKKQDWLQEFSDSWKQKGEPKSFNLTRDQIYEILDDNIIEEEAEEAEEEVKEEEDLEYLEPQNQMTQITTVNIKSQLDPFHLKFVANCFWVDIKQKEQISRKYLSDTQLEQLYIENLNRISNKALQWKKKMTASMDEESPLENLKLAQDSEKHNDDGNEPEMKELKMRLHKLETYNGVLTQAQSYRATQIADLKLKLSEMNALEIRYQKLVSIMKERGLFPVEEVKLQLKKKKKQKNRN